MKTDAQHEFDDHVDGLTYCSRCGWWQGAVEGRPCQPRDRAVVAQDREHMIDELYQDAAHEAALDDGIFDVITGES